MESLACAVVTLLNFKMNLNDYTAIPTIYTAKLPPLQEEEMENISFLATCLLALLFLFLKERQLGSINSGHCSVNVQFHFEVQ